MLSAYARNEWLTILAVGAMIGVALCLLGYWPVAFGVGVFTFALLLFFRDPERRIPSQRGAVVAPSDGKVSSIHEVEHFEPFDGPATCVRIFMSVFDVHLNRVPCHGRVAAITHKAGLFRNTLNPQAAEDNQTVTTVLVHPVKGHPVAAVRQVAGMLARTIHNGLAEGKVVQRGQRMGIIKLGSTTELYLPQDFQPVVKVRQGQKILGGITILATVTPPTVATPEAPETTGFISFQEVPDRPTDPDAEPTIFDTVPPDDR